MLSKNKFPFRRSCLLAGFICVALGTFHCTQEPSRLLKINKDIRILIVGNNLCSRMMNFGHFETELQLRYPDSLVFIRNMCDGGNTPGFRPHAGRLSPWAFPGADGACFHEPWGQGRIAAQVNVYV